MTTKRTARRDDATTIDTLLLGISPLMAAVRAQYRLEWHGVHGAAHWGRVLDNALALVPETGFAQPGSAECLQVRRMPGGTALIEGYVTGPGTVLAAGRAIATVPEGFRPRVQVWQASGLVFASLPMEAAEININTSGVASIARASVASAACVYIRALYST